MDLATVANKLRRDVLLMTSEAGSGHPTSCLSCADIMSVLFFKTMRFNPKDPATRNQDVFVLSKGHCAPILYATLRLSGATDENLLNLRRFDSVLEGHPTPRFKWVKAATGSLGQGLSVGCGIAYARRQDGVKGITYVLLGDGEVAEGSVWEAVQFAGYHKLSNLVAIVDVNGLGQSGKTMFEHEVESYRKRFDAFGWDVKCIDGHNLNEIEKAFSSISTDSPTVIVAKTIKGKGVSFLEGKDGWHGKALKKGSELESALKEIPDSAIIKPVPDRSYTNQIKIEADSSSHIEVSYKLGQEVATREAYGNALVKLGMIFPRLFVLDGDVKNSTFAEKFKEKFPSRFVEMFIAEQNMIGVALGLATEGKIPFSSSFACFLTRAYDFIRMSAYSRPAHLIICGSHAGISIGEDGPSQMGLEDIAMMRAVYGSKVLYPSDGISAERLTELAIKAGGIVYIRTTRPKTSVIYEPSEEFHLGGSKVLRSSSQDVATVVSAGITVYEALRAYETLKARNIFIRVVDAYSIKPLDAQTLSECAKKTKNIITVEDHSPAGGLGEAVSSELSGKCTIHILAVREIPRSGKPEELLDTFGISASSITKKVLDRI